MADDGKQQNLEEALKAKNGNEKGGKKIISFRRLNRTTRVTAGMLISVAALLLIYFYYESFIIITVGMMPSWIFILTNTGKQSVVNSAVTWLNGSGCMLVLMDLWTDANNFSYMVELLSDWITWAIMFSFAALGWVLQAIIPPFVENYLEISYKLKLKYYYNQKKSSEEEWGEDIQNASDLETLTDMEQKYEDMQAHEEQRAKRAKAYGSDDVLVKAEIKENPDALQPR